jgi:hypothetical protein
MVLFARVQIPTTITKNADIPAIIKAAAESPLGIIALVLLLFAGLAYRFFGKQGPKVTVPIFAALLVGGALCVWAVIRVPKRSEFQIAVHVLDSGTGADLDGARIQLVWGTIFQTGYTDSEGHFAFDVDVGGAIPPKLMTLSIVKDGYLRYTRQIADSDLNMPQEIRMRIKEEDRSQAAGAQISNKLSPRNCDEEASLKYVTGELGTIVQFDNLRSTPVDIYWIDYVGKKQFYSELQSNSSTAYDTFVGYQR